ncbi:MAG: hypothetical protein QF570_04250 [Myxococcota bacterium]|jgi:hypothetical protein|nr:hypothetical protein [Myxococcota bacterium]
MPLNTKSAAILKTGRRLVSLFLTTLAVSTGCSDSGQPTSAPLAPVPKVHTDGKAPAAPIPPPPAVTPPGLAKNAITDVMAEKEFFERARLLAELLPMLGAEAVPDVVGALTNFEVNTQVIEVTLLARFWALHEPEDASRWALFTAPAAFRSAVILPTMTEWARIDPFAAQDLIETARRIPGATTSVMEVALVRGWFYSETPGLEDYIRGLGIGPNRQRAIRTLLRSTIDEYGPERAINWVEAVADDDKKFRLASFRQLAMELGNTHLDEAMTFCAKWCDHPEVGQGLRKHVAQQWAKREGASAMEFVKKSPPNYETERAAKWAFRGWYSNDKEEFRGWLRGIGPENAEPWMQPMLELVAVDLGRQDPHEGLAWARAIKHNQDRRRTVTTVLTNWRRKSPEEADAWLDTTNLPDTLKERVRYYGRPQEEVKADPNPAPERVKGPRLYPNVGKLAEHDDDNSE